MVIVAAEPALFCTWMPESSPFTALTAIGTHRAKADVVGVTVATGVRGVVVVVAVTVAVLVAAGVTVAVAVGMAVGVTVCAKPGANAGGNVASNTLAKRANAMRFMKPPWARERPTFRSLLSQTLPNQPL